MMNKFRRKTHKKKMLFSLVVMIFFIMLISMVIAGVVSMLLIRTNIIPNIYESRLIPLILYMTFVSLFSGIILAQISGKRFLCQINELADFTKEVASGNFDVRMTEGKTREIERITRSMNEMVKELSNIETLRSDFVSNISHEFKTPVSSIRGFARRLKKDTLTKEQRNEYIDIIISESERLTRLSSNILLLSRLENVERLMEKTEYSLDEQLRKTILLLEPQLQSKKLEVDVKIEAVQIIADDEMLSHLWINLLENAIKFSPDKSTVTVTLGKADGNAVATISDMGVGMSDEVKNRLFDKFYQGDPSRSAEGNGLGLALAKRILELEGGKIEVDSKLGKGTSFKVSLPLVKQG